MPPVSKRDAVVILFDLNTEEDFANEAREGLLEICIRKWFFKPKDIGRIIFFNTNKTKNVFGFENIAEVTETVTFTPSVEKLYRGHTPAVSNWVEALRVAVESVAEHFTENGIMCRQLLFITDFKIKSEGQIRDALVTEVVEKLNDLDIWLYIIGPPVNVPSMLRSYEDIRNWMRTLPVEQNDFTDLQIAKDIVKRVKNGLMCNLDMGRQLFFYYRKWTRPQPFQLPLSVGSKLLISTLAVRCVRRVSLHRPVFRINRKTNLTLTTNPELILKRWDVIKAYQRLGKIVIFTDDVKKSFKRSGPRIFRLIGFVNKSQLPEYYFGGGDTAFLFPGKGIKVNRVTYNSKMELRTLVKVMRENEMYAIVQRAYLPNCKAKYYVLVPAAGSANYFYMSPMGFKGKDASRFVGSTRSTTDQEQTPYPLLNDEICNYLDSLDVDETENQSCKVPLSPQLQFSPYVSQVLGVVGKKYLKQELPEDTTVEDHFPTPDAQAVCRVWDETDFAELN